MSLPEPELVDAAVQLFAAAAHRARVVVLVALSRRGPMSAGELQELAGLEQTAMSHQLRTLREANLISSHREGRRVIYALQDEHVARIVEDTIAHVAEESG